MTSYRVTVTRDTTESTVVEIEATSPEEADTAALDQAILHGHKLVWTLDEGNALNHSPYIGDPGNAEARPSEEEKIRVTKHKHDRVTAGRIQNSVEGLAIPIMSIRPLYQALEEAVAAGKSDDELKALAAAFPGVERPAR